MFKEYQAGHAETGRSGKVPCSVPPYGYMFKNEDKTVLHLDREVSGNVRFIFDKRLEGEKYSEIAKNDERKGNENPYGVSS